MLQPRKKPVDFFGIIIRPMVTVDIEEITDIEKRVYTPDHRQGASLLTHVRRKNGLAYSQLASGIHPRIKKRMTIGYIIGVDDKLDNGRRCVYLDDFAIIPEAQRQGIGWRLMRVFIKRLKRYAQEKGKPILLDMHMTAANQSFMARHARQLSRLGVQIVEEDTYPEYYAKEHDALYRVYRVASS